MVDSSHPIIGVRFDISKANSDEYGQEFWRIIWGAIDPTALYAVWFYEGDTENTLLGNEEVYCIAFQCADDAEIQKLHERLRKYKPLRDVAAEPMFIAGEICTKEPLVNSGHINFAGQFSEDAINPKRSLANLKGISLKSFEDPNWKFRPPFTMIDRKETVGKEKKCAICSYVFTSDDIQCPKCGSGVLQSEKKHTFQNTPKIDPFSPNSKDDEPKSVTDWLKYCLNAFPRYGFPGSGYFILGVASAAFGLWALSWYVIHGVSFDSVPTPSGTTSSVGISNAPGFITIWKMWWHWAVLTLSGILLLRFSFKKWMKSGAEGPLFVKTVKKLLSKNEEYFGEGLAEVEAIPTNNPMGLRILKEAMRQRSDHIELQFYVPGISITKLENIENSRDKILELAERRALLEDTEVSGKLISTFQAAHSFQDIVALAYEVSEVGGIDQAQVFQLIFNQLRLEAKQQHRVM